MTTPQSISDLTVEGDLVPASADRGRRREFIVIVQWAWSDGHACGVHYDWDGERFASRKSAIKHGFTLDRSDDFNIGVLVNNELASFDWMDEPLETTAGEIAEIAEQIGVMEPRP